MITIYKNQFIFFFCNFAEIEVREGGRIFFFPQKSVTPWNQFSFLLQKRAQPMRNLIYENRYAKNKELLHEK